MSMSRGPDAGDAFDTGLDDRPDTRSLQQQVKELKHLNRQLKSDLSRTQKQYDAILNEVAATEKVHQENGSLRQQVAELKARNEDLHRRLEISTQANSDLNARLQKSTGSPVGQTDMTDLESQLRELQQASRAELDQFKQTMKDNNANYARLQSDQALLKSQLSRIVSAAQVYFRSEFANAASLLDFLMHPPAPPTSESSAAIGPELEQQLRKARSRLANETKQRKQLELEVLELRKAAETDTLNHSNKLAEFQESLRDHMNERKRMEQEHQKAISELQGQLRQQRNTKSLSTQTMITDIGFSALEKQSLQDELHKRNDKITQLEEKVRDLTTQIADRAVELDAVTKQAKKANSQTGQLAKELRGAQKAVSGLESDVGALKKENDQRAANEASLKAQIADLEAGHAAAVERAQRDLELAHDKLRSQEEELERAISDRDRVLDEQAKLLANAEKLIQAKQKPAEPVPVLTIAQDEFEWDFGALPDDLIEILKNISENDGFSLEMRIKQSFAVVAKWLHNLEKAHEQDMGAANTEYESAKRELDDLTSALLNVVDGDDLDLNQLIAEVAKLKAANTKYEEQIDEFDRQHPVVFDQTTYDDLQAQIRLLQQRAKAFQAKSKRHKIELRECKAAFMRCRGQSEKGLQTIRAQYERAALKNDELQAQIDALHEANKAARAEIEQMQQHQDSDHDRSRVEFDAMLEDQSSRFDELQKQAADTISEQRDTIKKLERRANELEETARKLDVQLHEVLKKNEALCDKLNHSESRNRELEDVAGKSADLAELACEQRVDELQQKVDTLQLSVDRLQTELEGKNESVRTLSAQLDQEKFAKRKTSMKSQSRIDALEREKKLLEVQTKTKVMAIETDFTIQIELLRQKVDNERRTLYGFLAEQFQIYYDAKQPLDESVFKGIVGRVKNELERQRKQELAIRKMVKAKESQSTAEALMDMMMGLKTQPKGHLSYV
jgi:chromosome segregation ATPase